MARASQCPEVMNDDIKAAREALDDALAYLTSCPPYAIDAAERYVERCRAALFLAKLATEEE
jgi:hypothetical protein